MRKNKNLFKDCLNYFTLLFEKELLAKSTTTILAGRDPRVKFKSNSGSEIKEVDKTIFFSWSTGTYEEMLN